MKLTIATPDALIVDREPVTAVRAEDETGGFGLLPGHQDFVTVLIPSVLSFQPAEGARRHCAVHGGVLVMQGGGEVRVTTRGAVLGSDLEALAAEVRDRLHAVAAAETAAAAQTETLHLQAIRRMATLLRGDRPGRRAP